MSRDKSGPVEPNPYSVPVQDAELVQPSAVGDATGGMIPYKNPAALVSYYLGLFSFIPLIGLFLAVPALVLGIMGLRARKRDPTIKGSLHAWIGIVLGGSFALIWGSIAVLVIVGLVFQV